MSLIARSAVAFGALILLASCATSTREPAVMESAARLRLTAEGHCLAACPSVPRGDQLVEHTLYTLANDGGTKFADWVAYVVHAEWIASGRPRNWQADPDVDEADTLEDEDYRGANAAYDYEMGHQAPLQSFGGADEWEEVNYLSNIMPQIGNLNGGRWGALERAERELARELDRPVYVMSGPLYERRMPALPQADERHRVPSGFWKVVALSDGRVAGFIFQNRAEEGSTFCDEIVSVSEIERRSRLNLFPGIALRSLGDLSSDIGC